MSIATPRVWSRKLETAAASTLVDAVQPPAGRSRLRAALRAEIIILSMLVVVPITFMLWLLRLERLRARLVQLYLKGLKRVVGIRVDIRGVLDSSRPLMLVANHAGYLDVFVIGSAAPVSFTPKREVRSWPVIGFLCVLADCVFVERKPSHMQEARKKMLKRLNRDKILCLFPEGTTSDNSNVREFKSGFFSLAEIEDADEEPLPVQPATLFFSSIGGKPMQAHWRSMVAWVGDDTFFDHFWRVLKLPSIEVILEFHPPHILPRGGSRKELSQNCEDIIRASLLRLSQSHSVGITA